MTEHGLAGRTIAQALGMRKDAGRSAIEPLGEVSGDRALLVVFDNFEQLVEPAQLVTPILGGRGNLRVLVNGCHCSRAGRGTRRWDFVRCRTPSDGVSPY